MLITSSLYFGGAQKVTYLLATALAKKYDVTVVYSYGTRQSHQYGEECRVRKLPEYRREDPVLLKQVCIYKQIRTLRELKKELKIDVSISLGNLSNYINVMSKGKEYVICSERSNPKKSWNGLFRVIWLSLMLADHVVFQSETVRQMFGKRIQKKSSILKNPLVAPPPANEERSKKIVNLGRLSKQKNQALLIHSFARFVKEFPEYKLYIYGDGELEGSLEELIDSLKLSDQVVLEANRADVHDVIRDAEMFVLSSDFEGLSNALLECMSMGIASISTRCEGSVDVIRNGENGLLVDMGDEEGLTEALKMLAKDPELRKRLEKQAREDMKAFDRDVVIQDWEKVILRGIR